MKADTTFYTMIETDGVGDIRNVEHFADKNEARAVYDRACEENALEQDADEIYNDSHGFLAAAGDRSWSVYLFESTLS